MSSSIDDIVDYDSREIPAISRRALHAYGAGHVVVDKRYLIYPVLLTRARSIGDELFGRSAVVYEDELTLAYAIPVEQQSRRGVLWLDTGWSYLERLDRPGGAQEMRWRWMGDHARVALTTDVSTDVRLRMTAQAFGRPRHLRLSIGDSEIAILPTTTSRSDFETPSFRIPAGLSFVDFNSVDGSDSAGADLRRLSVALFHVALTESSDR